MNYQTYLKYRESVHREYRVSNKTHPLLALDELNPYTLLAQITDLHPASCNISEGAAYVKSSTGVRQLLREIFTQFINEGYQIALPEDIYPVYFECVPKAAAYHTYPTLKQRELRLPATPKAIALIANPLIPEGNYLSQQQLESINQWLNADPGRWLVCDNVYDFLGTAHLAALATQNVIYVNSLTKLALKPGELGWATCNKPLAGFTQANPEHHLNYAPILQQAFSRAWNGLQQRLTDLDPHWRIPQVGYLATVDLNYKTLLRQNISAIPIQVFGSQQDDISVLSCLSKVEF
ncbi:MAG: hypothetical protein OEZ68_21795 [Gammaproteobacteria bacterium]|nr:hypothetical protein [Gammaproteobacteria bacterium]MDH5803432.1 hypothetical protein [Gammaproteobacteria bacterium]